MLQFGEKFGKNIVDSDLENTFRGISRPTDDSIIQAPAGDVAWGTPSRVSTRMGENATAGPAGSIVIELIGDVGAGKTTFVRGLAQGLGIKEPITSPSFTISKSYAIPSGGTLTHYDFYRLSDPGLMLEDLQESINNDKIVIVEWADSVANILPENRIIIRINYNDDGSREIIS